MKPLKKITFRRVSPGVKECRELMAVNMKTGKEKPIKVFSDGSLFGVSPFNATFSRSGDATDWLLNAYQTGKHPEGWEIEIREKEQPAKAPVKEPEPLPLPEDPREMLIELTGREGLSKNDIADHIGTSGASVRGWFQKPERFDRAVFSNVQNWAGIFGYELRLVKKVGNDGN